MRQACIPLPHAPVTVAVAIMSAVLVRPVALAQQPGAGQAPLVAPVQVASKASVSDVSVGQPFTVDVEVAGPPGATFSFPEAAGDEKVELRLATPPADAAPSPNRRSYRATAFALEGVAVPAITVGYRLADGSTGKGTSPPIPLRIVSLLPKDPEGRKPADIRPPVGIPIGAPFWVACCLGLAAIAALVVWLSRRRRKTAATTMPETPPVAPDVEAREALDRLAGSGLLEQERFKEFYVTLAEIAKRYLERRLEAPVLEMTSSEALAFLRDHAHGRDLAPGVRDLVNTADFVKFARGAAAVETGQRHLAAVRGTVNSLEARLRAAEAPPIGPPTAAREAA